MQLSYDTTAEGFALFNGPLKIAVVSCMAFAKKMTTRDKADGSGVETDAQGHPVLFHTLEPLPRRSWGIHLTSPAMSIELMEAMVAALPKGDDPSAHSVPRVSA